jgi:ubiquinone/menaquinone biosynthesis C-methylase UbiE
MRVDYDSIAAAYDGRYERNDYSGIERALSEFLSVEARRVLEVGCGTGHWLRAFRCRQPVGLDPAEGMLKVARSRGADARVVRAGAESLPFPTGNFDRLFCVNSLHHFTDPMAFFREARRVLVNGGGLLTIGLDPHTGRDRWWIYDYFPTVLVEDRRRYLPAASIRELMQAAGFSRCDTREVMHMPAQMTVGEAARRGFLDRASTSQLMVISDAEFEAGNESLRAAGNTSMLRSDLRVYGTTGWIA